MEFGWMVPLERTGEMLMDKPIFRDFMCRCGKDGKKRCDFHYKAAKKILGNPSDKDFVHVAIFTLNWNYQIDIEGIYNDQWSVVIATHRPDEERIYIECDLVHDGIARLLTWAHKTYKSAEEV